VITEARLRDLAAFRADDVVTTLYLDVDGRRYPRAVDVDPQLDHLVRTARAAAAQRDDASHVGGDLDRIVARCREGFDRSRVRGVAFFACGAQLFEVVLVPAPVRNQVVLNQVPALRQLEYLLDEYEPFMVVLVDRRRARLLRFDMGELVDRSELIDDVPPRVDGTDDGGLMASHVQQHADEMARRHLRRAADAVRRELEGSKALRVILGGPAEAVAEFEDLLHASVRGRVEARLSISAQARESEIRAAALDVEAQVERRSEQALVDRLREQAGADHAAVVGLDETLRALFDRRVDTLVVSNAFEQPGWRCGACACLATRGRTCSMCGAEMDAVDDIVGEAVDAAFLQDARVELCDNVDLDVVGRIGALLRF
jgi:peptide subunit release factor 1 (eRF1)